jgi:hypothetical protein
MFTVHPNKYVPYFTGYAIFKSTADLKRFTLFHRLRKISSGYNYQSITSFFSVQVVSHYNNNFFIKKVRGGIFNVVKIYL